jgi:hypothetical protein
LPRPLSEVAVVNTQQPIAEVSRFRQEHEFQREIKSI